jgi:hypothetical protein
MCAWQGVGSRYSSACAGEVGAPGATPRRGRRGAEGESQTAAALDQLGREWTHWHDLRWPGRRSANIDHIAIGPRDSFVIDSKNWSGSLTVKEKVLRQNGYRRETAVAGCADSVLAVGELLPRYMDQVKPVLCFVRQEEVKGWAREVMLCATTNLVAMLTSREPVLDADEIADALATLHVRMSSMHGPQSSALLASAGRPSTVQSTPAVSYRPARPLTTRRTRLVKRCATAPDFGS